MLTYLYNLLLLFVEFFKTGLFAVGGGLATVPFIRDMLATHNWVPNYEAVIADIIAIAESTPGPIGVNAATYVGYNVAGVPGSIVATLGLITPSVIIIILVAKAIKKYASSYLVQSLFSSLRPAAIGLITAAVPQAPASSKVESSSSAMGRRSTFMPMVSASCIKLLLVMEGRIDVLCGVR